VRLRWDDVRRDRIVESSERITTCDFSSSLETADPHLELDVAVAEYADILHRGTWSRIVDLRRLAATVPKLADRFGADIDVREFVGLVEQAVGPQLSRPVGADVPVPKEKGPGGSPGPSQN
jgi:hypothetical protein